MTRCGPQLPGLIIEPLVFAVLAYWLAGLRDDVYAFLVTSAVVVLTMNVSTACGACQSQGVFAALATESRWKATQPAPCLSPGFFFSTAFESVPTAMAYLVPFDYVLMITSGVFIKLSTLPAYVSWTQYLSWLMYSNEAMSIVQWQGVSNISAYPCCSSSIVPPENRTLPPVFEPRPASPCCSLPQPLATVPLGRRTRAGPLLVRRVTPVPGRVGHGRAVRRVPPPGTAVPVPPRQGAQVMMRPRIAFVFYCFCTGCVPDRLFMLATNCCVHFRLCFVNRLSLVQFFLIDVFVTFSRVPFIVNVFSSEWCRVSLFAPVFASVAVNKPTSTPSASVSLLWPAERPERMQLIGLRRTVGCLDTGGELTVYPVLATGNPRSGQWSLLAHRF